MAQLEFIKGYSIEQIRGQYLNTQKTAHQPATTKTGQTFEEILNQQKAEASGALKFSKHANERLESRNIDLTEGQKERLEGAVKKAEAKGIKESLVMMDNLAFIVNVKNSTVVTAVTGEEERIFSNIDGAVIV